MNDNIRIYIITSEAYIDYREKHNIKRVEDIPDNDFIDMAEEEGTIYSLNNFQFQWNNNPEFMPYADCSYIRVIEV